jgi:hypothetical protein
VVFDGRIDETGELLDGKLLLGAEDRSQQACKAP